MPEGQGGASRRTGAIGLGLAASFFFASTFVLNRRVSEAGGSWVWTGALRFAWMVPLLVVPALSRGRLGPVIQDLHARPGAWLLWSTVGFGLFYAPVAFAASRGPGWLVAGTWQATIVAGLLLGPLLGAGRISRRALAFSGVVLAGIALVQSRRAGAVGAEAALAGTLPVLVGAVAYPLGNRRTMALVDGRLDASQRVLGMTLASLPFWGLLTAIGTFAGEPLPGRGQLVDTFLVALLSGVVATVLFFAATDRVRNDPRALAAVEATQSGEVVFALAGEVVLLGAAFPDPLSCAGLALVVAGLVLHALAGRRT